LATAALVSLSESNLHWNRPGMIFTCSPGGGGTRPSSCWRRDCPSGFQPTPECAFATAAPGEPAQPARRDAECFLEKRLRSSRGATVRRMGRDPESSRSENGKGLSRKWETSLSRMGNAGKGSESVPIGQSGQPDACPG